MATVYTFAARLSDAEAKGPAKLRLQATTPETLEPIEHVVFRPLSLR